MNHAKVAELVDAHDSKSCSFGSVGSIPTFGTCYPFLMELDSPVGDNLETAQLHKDSLPLPRSSLLRQ